MNEKTTRHAETWAWWVTSAPELDDLAPIQLLLADQFTTKDGSKPDYTEVQKRHLAPHWSLRLKTVMMQMGFSRVAEEEYAAPSASAQPTHVDLTGLADRLLAPREIVRDEYGHFFNPAFPVLDESDNVRMFLGAFGIDLCQVSMESDCDDEALRDAVWAGEKGCGEWAPTPPAGDGWVLSDIFDTEDGPYAQFIRRKPPEPKKSRRELVAAPAPSASPEPVVLYGGGATPISFEDGASPAALTDKQITDLWNMATGSVYTLQSRAIAFARALLAASPTKGNSNG